MRWLRTYVKSSSAPNPLDHCPILNAVIQYTDYHGPQRGFAVIKGKLVPFDRDAALHMAQNAHLLALGDPEYAAEMTAAAGRAEHRPAAA